MSATKDFLDEVIAENREREQQMTVEEKVSEAAEGDKALLCLYCHRPLPKDLPCTNCNI
jgi:hypothetical protein